MPQSYDRIVLHTTFGTKYRQPFIDEHIEPELHSVIAAELKAMDAKVIAIGGIADHLHIIHTLPRTQTISNLISKMKAVSSKWIKTKGEDYEWFEWQDGYGTFSVDYRNMDDVIRYVRNQKEHHATTADHEGMDYREEYGKFMKAYGFKNYTEHYVFPISRAYNASKARRAAYRSEGRSPSKCNASGTTSHSPTHKVTKSE